MKKLRIYFLFSFIFILSMQNIYAINPLDSNWRDYVFDKQVWDLGVINNIITIDNKVFVSCFSDIRNFDSTIFNCLAQLNDSAMWVPLGDSSNSGIQGDFPIINCMELKDSILYIGGSFSLAGNLPVKNLACWNVNSNIWQSCDLGTNGIITSIKFDSNNVYIAGNFDTVFTSQTPHKCNNIAKWNGSNLDSLNYGTNGPISEMTWQQNNLIVVGEFDSVGNIYGKNIGIWNKTNNSWSTFGNYGPIGEISTVCSTNNKIYFAGQFDSVNTSISMIASKNLVSYSNNEWNNLEDGINGDILKMKVRDDNLYVVGSFEKEFEDSTICENIAIWSGSTWLSFGSGTDELIYSLDFIGDSLLVCGAFNFTGDTLAMYIGLWYNPYINQNLIYELNPFDRNNTENRIAIYPNPLSNFSKIEFQNFEKGKIELSIFNQKGSLVSVLTNMVYETGIHTLIWDTSKIPSGIYICQMKTKSDIKTVKVVVGK